jgi:hypothetical protein
MKSILTTLTFFFLCVAVALSQANISMIETGPIKVERFVLTAITNYSEEVKNILLKEQAEVLILHVLLSMEEIR